VARSQSLFLITFGGCRVLFCFNGNVHVGTLFEAYLIAVFIRQGVLNADFLIQGVSPLDEYLRLLRFAWTR